MRYTVATLEALAWITLAGALAFTVIDGLLFSEGPHGFLPTAALFGFAALGTVSAVLFTASRRLAGRAWIKTPLGAAHAGALAIAYVTFTFLLLFR